MKFSALKTQINVVSSSYNFHILWKYFYSMAPKFVFSTKCSDPYVLEFVLSNITSNNQWENCILLDYKLQEGLSEPLNPRKLDPHD